MQNTYFGIAVIALIIVGVAPVLLPIPVDRLEYPNSKRVDHVDTYLA